MLRAPRRTCGGARRRRRPAAARGPRRPGLHGDDVGDQAGDVVGAAGLEGGADQLDGGEVGGAGGEDVGEPPVVERAARAVAAEQDAVPGDQLDVEQVGLGLVDAVHGLEDEVAVRVGAGLLLGDPALVDERLDERVVAGQLADRAVAEEVGTGVPEVAEAEAVSVEEGHGRGGAGAGQRRVVLDELTDPVVGAVDRPGDDGEQVVVLGVYVEPPQLLDRRTGRDVPAGGPADSVAHGEQPGPGVAGVLVVLADPADIGDGGVLQAQARRAGGHRSTSAARGSSCRSAPACPG